ncbi:MAG: SPOR domain-containing protein [Pseudomonadota bacterium]
MSSLDDNGFKPSVPLGAATAPAAKGNIAQLFENAGLKWAGAGASLLLFAGIIGISYSIGSDDAQNGAIPIIVSEGTPIKVRPQDPGGKQFPYQDMTVYQNLRGGDGQVEKQVVLADPPEVPSEFSPAEKMALEEAARLSEGLDDGAIEAVSAPVGSDIEKTPQKNIPQFASLVKDSKPVEDTAEIVSEVKKNAPADMQKNSNAMAPAKNKPIAKKAPQMVQKKAEVAQRTSTGPFLQVGAYRSKLEAKKAWKTISARFGSVLKVDNHMIVKADLKNKGTFYRLRVGPYASKNAAVNVCSSLKAKSQGCMFVMQ